MTATLTLSRRVKTLVPALAGRKSLANSTLFYGPGQAPLKKVALYYVLSLLNLISDDGKLDPENSQVKQVLAGGDPDIRFFEFSGAIKIDEVRDIQEKIKYGPFQSDRLIVILNPVDALTVQAGNALLKTLEEPPERTHFILLTHHLTSILPTIRSRSQCIDIASDPAYIEELPVLAQLSPLWFESSLAGVLLIREGSATLKSFLTIPLFERLLLVENLPKEKPQLLTLLQAWLLEWKETFSNDPQYQKVPTLLLTLMERLQFNVSPRLQCEAFMIQLD